MTRPEMISDSVGKASLDVPLPRWPPHRWAVEVAVVGVVLCMQSADALLVPRGPCLLLAYRR